MGTGSLICDVTRKFLGARGSLVVKALGYKVAGSSPDGVKF
jgi:hypothetical protein